MPSVSVIQTPRGVKLQLARVSLSNEDEIAIPLALEKKPQCLALDDVLRGTGLSLTHEHRQELGETIRSFEHLMNVPDPLKRLEEIMALLRKRYEILSDLWHARAGSINHPAARRAQSNEKCAVHAHTMAGTVQLILQRLGIEGVIQFGPVKNVWKRTGLLFPEYSEHALMLHWWNEAFVRGSWVIFDIATGLIGSKANALMLKKAGYAQSLWGLANVSPLPDDIEMDLSELALPAGQSETRGNLILRLATPKPPLEKVASKKISFWEMELAIAFHKAGVILRPINGLRVLR